MTTTLDPPLVADRRRRPAAVAGPGPDRVTVRPGLPCSPAIERGPSLAAHRDQHGTLPRLDRAALLADLERIRCAVAAAPGSPSPRSWRRSGRGRAGAAWST